MELENSCLGCGCSTDKGNRRILSNFTTVQSVLKDIIVFDFKIDESLVETIFLKHRYICNKCFKQIDKFVKIYSNIQISLSAVVSTAFLGNDTQLDDVNAHVAVSAETTCSRKRNVSSLTIPLISMIPKIDHETEMQRKQAVAVSRYLNFTCGDCMFVHTGIHWR
jgi:hypothetical protein